MKENKKNESVLDLEIPDDANLEVLDDDMDWPVHSGAARERELERDPALDLDMDIRPEKKRSVKKNIKKVARRKDYERARAERIRQTNREIRITAAILVIFFIGTIGYLGHFLFTESETYRNSSYNSKRQALLGEKYERGDILAYDGTVLATNAEGDDQKRSYPQGKLYAHAVGYSVGGVTGLESTASSYLLDSNTNLLSQMFNELTGSKIEGDSIRSTLVPAIQKAAYDALGDRQGAIVVMEPTTGRVLAMVSKPDFDPNTLNGNFENLDEGTLVNRATQGLYTPGSTFKILTALEYMRENPNSWDDYSFDCTGTFYADSYLIRCYDQTEHGTLDLKKAFAESCNGAFASMGSVLNFKKFHTLCEDMGFNNLIGLGAARSKFNMNNSNSLWNVLQTSIGQGETEVTPLLNCMIVASVANNGVMMKPTMVDSVINGNGRTVRRIEPTEYNTVMSSEEAVNLKAMMTEVCASGTGTNACGEGYNVFGKTGSAEVTSDGVTNAWFVGCASASTPSQSRGYNQLAISIVVEEGGTGGSVAAPIAKEIFEKAFK